MPCLFWTLAITPLRDFLSFVALFAISPNPCSTNQFLTQACWVSNRRCFPLFLLPSICTVSVKVSKPLFLIMHPRNFNFLFLMLILSVFFVFIFSLKLCRWSQVQSVVFSSSFCRTTFLLCMKSFFSYR